MGGDQHYLIMGTREERTACGASAPWSATSHLEAVSCLQCRASEPYARAWVAYRDRMGQGAHRGPVAVLEEIEGARYSQWVASQAQRLLDSSARLRVVLADDYGHPADCICPTCRYLAATAALFAQILKEAQV